MPDFWIFMEITNKLFFLFILGLKNTSYQFNKYKFVQKCFLIGNVVINQNQIIFSS